MHYYQFNIADYRKDTTHFSMLEHGAYRQLLDWLYLEQKPLPTETQVVMRRLSAKSESERLAVQTVLDEMFTLTENGYIQGRVMHEIANYEHKGDIARVNGKAGGRPKKPIETQVVILDNPEVTQTKAKSLTHKPINSIIKTPPTPTKINFLDNGFLEFWFSYPKKTGKDKALQAWMKKKPKVDDVLTALNWQKQSEQWQKEKGQFIPNPATYLNEGRWQDEPTSEGAPF